MRYHKSVSGGYINSVGTGAGGTEITKSEYDEILAVLQTKPEATDATDYLLRDDLTWEAYAVDPVPEPELSLEEVLTILLGGE
ncbi:MAG: hypothetical protein IJM76_06030 [Lachnospiraceae bacterium]|nr:hypothetical protein [Lachnospiraceae bacterium]